MAERAPPVADRAAMYSHAAMRAFEVLFLPWMRTRIDVVVTAMPAALPVGEPIVFAANHVSWWDGFLVRALHRRMRPGATLFTLVSERELRQRAWLRLLGACAVERSPGGLLRLVRALERRRRRDPGLCVAVFPQGGIWPSSRRPLGFARGVELFARRLAPCAVVPVALHVEPLNRVRPTAFVRAGAPIPSSDATVAAVEAAVAHGLADVHAHLDALGERAVAR